MALVWKVKITGIEKAERGGKHIVVSYTILLNGDPLTEDQIKIDVGDYGLFTNDYLLKEFQEKMIKHSWPEISKEIVFRKMTKKVGEEMEINNADISA